MRIYDIEKRAYDNKYNIWVHIDHLLHQYESDNIHTNYINIGVGNNFMEAVEIKNNFFKKYKTID